MISPHPREPNGRKQRPMNREQKEAAAVKAVVMAQPHRRGNDNPLQGYPLGRLKLTGNINADQFHAGERYAKLFRRHAMLINGVSHRLPSPVYENVASGLPCIAELDDEDLFALRREWNEAVSAIRELRDWQDAIQALDWIVVYELDPAKHTDVGNMRSALNALHNLWR